MLAKNIKRILVWFLTILVVVSMSSQAVRADTNNGNPTAVARIGDNYYDSLEAAVSAAQQGSGDNYDTIVMTADSTEPDGELVVTKKVAIDLAGYTVTKNGTLNLQTNSTIKDSGAAKTGTIDAQVKVSNGATLTVESGTLTSASRDVIYMDGGRMVDIKKDASVIAAGDANYAINSGENDGLNGALLYGTVRAKNHAVRLPYFVIYPGASVTCEQGTAVELCGEDGLMAMQGGSIEAQSGIGVLAKGSECLIYDGEIYGSEYGVYLETGAVYIAYGYDPVIRSSVQGKSVGKVEGTSFTIEKGYFGDDAGNTPGFTLPDGKMLIKGADPNHPALYSLGTAAAENDRTKIRYATLQEAIDEAVSGDTILLLSNQTVENTVTVDKNITFDAQSFTLSGNTMTMEVTGDAVLTFVGGTIESTSRNHAAIYVKDRAGVNMTGGTVKNTNGNSTMGAMRLTGSGASVISGGTVVTDGGGGAAVTCLDGSLTVSGASTLIESKGAEPSLRADYINFGGTITVEGGTIKNSGSGFAARSETGGTVTINGGTVQSSTANKSVINSNGTFNINGGKFSDLLGNNSTFTRPDGSYLTNEDGDEWYELTSAVAIITKGNQTMGYKTLKAAVDAAEAGDTIEIVADFTEAAGNTDPAGNLAIGKSITIDLAGHEVIKEGMFAVALGGTTLTIQDSSAQQTGTLRIKNYGSYTEAFFIGFGGNLNIAGGTIYTETPTAIKLTANSDNYVEIGENAKIIATGDDAAISTNGMLRVHGQVEAKGDAIETRAGSATIYEGSTVTSENGTAIRSNAILLVQGGTISGANYGILTTGSTTSVTGGEITGAQCGIKAEGGAVGVGGEGTGTIVKATAGPSVAVANGVPFVISGGAYSDDAGNADSFSRSDGMKLFRDVDGLYRLMPENVVAINDRSGDRYTRLQDAVDAAQAGDTVRLLTDLDEHIVVDKALTLDLDEKTIAGSTTDSDLIEVAGGNAHLTVIGGTIDSTGGSNNAIYVTDGGSLTLGEGAVVNSAESTAVHAFTVGGSYPESKVTIDGGTISTNHEYGLHIAGKASLDMKSGTVVNNNASTTGGAMLLRGRDAAILGGSIGSTGTGSTVVFGSNNGTLTISGEDTRITNNGTGAGLMSGVAYGGNDYPGNITVGGGIIRSEGGKTVAISDISGSTLTINGGKFSDDEGNDDAFTRADGKVLIDKDGDGLYELETPVAKRVAGGKDTFYISLAAAVDEAQDGDTVYLLQDATDHFSTAKEITLDLGENTLTVDADEGVQATAASSGYKFLTIENGTIVSGTTPADEAAKDIISANGGTIILGEDLIVTAASSAIYVYNGGEVTIDGADVSGASGFATATVTGADAYSSIHLNSGSLTGPSDGHPTVSVENGGGFYQQGGTLSASAGRAISVSGEDSTGYISDGIWISAADDCTAYAADGGMVMVQGGSVDSTSGSALMAAQDGEVVVIDGVINGEVAATNGSTFEITGGVFKTDTGNGDAFTRMDDKLLVKGANSEYPDMFALGEAVATIRRDGKTISYASLASAVADAKAGETVVMIADEELTSQVAIKKNLTLDLNGKKISANFSGAAIAFPFEMDPTQKTLTITDTSDAGNGSIRNTHESGHAVDVEANRTLNLEGGTLSGGNTGLALTSAYGTANIKDGSIEGGVDGISINGGKLTVEGGEVHGRSNGIIGGLGSPAPKIKISGGEISSSEASEGYCGIHLRGGELEVTGGTISGGTGISIATFAWDSSTRESSAMVSGGVVKGAFESIKSTDDTGAVDPSKFNITGGAFSDDIGNGADYTRSDNKELRKGDDNLYRLADVDKTALEQIIEDATEDMNATPVSADGKDLADGTEYVENQATKDALADAIAAAQAVMDDPKALQADVDAATAALEAAKQAFDEAKKTATVDKTALNDAITAATTDKNDTPVSADGKDRKPGTEYVDQDTQDALTEAIAAAQAVTDKEDATQNEVDAAKAALEAAKKAFDDAKKTASVDKTALNSAITAATTDKNDTPVSADGKDRKPGTEYVDQDTQDALTDAIAAAQAVANKEDATQNEVDEAITELEAAKKVFDDAKKTATVDKKTLNDAITAATTDKNDTPVSADGKDRKPGTKYVNQDAQDALTDAIAAAQAVMDDPKALQADVDAATAALEAAKQAFDEAKKSASVDKTELNSAITAATTDKNDTPVSADGKDRKPGTEYVDQDTQDALNDAVAAAQAVLDDADATQNDVDAAKAALDTAKQAFDDAKKSASVDKTALNDAITSATTDKNDTPVSADGKDLKPGTEYVDQDTQDALTEAIAAAQAVADKEDATQNEVDKATDELQAAKKAFDDAKKTATVDKKALNDAITLATTDKDDTPVSADGKDLADGTKYVDQATQEALTTAITKAQAVAEKEDATQNEVDAAKAALDTAKQAFDDAKKTASVDKTALNSAITAATTDKNDTPVSADGKDRKPGTEYVDQATQNALTDAIVAAQAVTNKEDATQNEVDAAKSALEAAKQAFDEAKKTATVDKTALNDAITSATEDKDDTPVSVDGKNRKSGTEYVDQDTQDALTDAIASAQAVANKEDATQNEVDAAKAALDIAKQAFDAAKKTATVDKTALNSVITSATEDKDDTPVSVDGKDRKPGTEYVDQDTQDALTAAIATAQAVDDDPGATQNQVDAAKAALEAAKQAFEDAKKTATVDKKALNDAITLATTDKDDTPVSADGKDLADGTKYVNQDTQEALTEAIAAAQAVANKEDATQNEVDAAKAALEAAKKAFDDAKKTASVDKTALNSAITSATEDKDATQVSADGKDRKPGTEYVAQDTQDALTDAIAAAQAVVNKEDATQNEVDKAADVLQAAKQAFDDAKKTASVNKEELEKAITDAKVAEKPNTTSEDGKDLAPGTTYTTPAEKKALDDAIEKAQRVFDDKEATQNEVEAATNAVKKAMEAYKANVKTAAVDKTALEQAIDEASKDKEATPVSEDGKDLENGTKYVDKATQDALTAAIAKAQEVLDNPAATQSEVDKATSDMKDALQAFDDAKKTAQNDEITKVDKTALEQAIDEATKDKEATPVSEDGKDLENGTKYVDKVTQDNLTAAIAKAQEVFDNPAATQSEVDKATSDMKDALQAFDKAKKTAQNDEITEVDKKALEKAINEATKDKKATPVSADGKDQPEVSLYVNQAAQDALTKAIEEAKKVFDNPNATQSEVDAATAAVTAAQMTFDDAKKNGLMHDFGGWTQTKTPTCTEAGEEIRVCSYDATHIETREIKALGHDFGEWTETKAPTCTEPGEENRVCKHDATHIETRSIDALGHDWDEGIITAAPDCTEDGVITYTCKHDSSHTRTVAISKTGHTWPGEKTVDIEPTCETEGEKSLHCEVCGAIDPESIEKIPPLGHDWSEWTVTKEATETEEGEESRICSRCGEVETRPVPKLEPKPDEPDNPIEPVDPVDPIEPIDPTEPTEPEDPDEPVEPTDPDDPVNPTDPDEPVNPTDPDEPVEPTDPDEPVEPTDPDEPVEPTDPDEPVEPTDPDEPVEPTDPDEPVDPTDPDEPVEPTDPDEPVEPTDPDEPVEPTDPDEPVEPTDPDEPVDPTDPDKPVEPTDPENPDEPVDPTDPDEPVEPTDPDEPVDPVDPTDPDEPVEPTDPDEPVEPTDPDKPVEPVDPVNPTDPDEPSEPVDPTDPENPDEPVDPTNPDEPDNNEDTDTKEKEADNTEKEPEKEPEDKATDIDKKSDTITEAGNKANVTPANTQKATNQKDTYITTAGTTKGTVTPTTGDNGFIPVYIIAAAGAALAAVLAGVGIKRRKRR